MPFSLGSYLLGVGTVVGALAFGFGGGVLLTHTAMKESPAGQTRIERLARVEPEPRPPRKLRPRKLPRRPTRPRWRRTRLPLLIRTVPHQSPP